MLINNINFCANRTTHKKSNNKPKAEPAYSPRNKQHSPEIEEFKRWVAAITAVAGATCATLLPAIYAIRNPAPNSSNKPESSACETFTPPTAHNYNTLDEIISAQTDASELNFEIDLTIEQEISLMRFVQNWEKNSDRYYAMEEETGVPAELIAAIHWRESGGNFNTYLHNGAKLGKPISTFLGERTYYTWEESAKDALLNYAQPEKIIKDNIETYYDFAERYNGMGYSKYHNMRSPYVWAGTHYYTSGKYTADGKFNPDVVDKQVGVAVLLSKIIS